MDGQCARARMSKKKVGGKESKKVISVSHYDPYNIIKNISFFLIRVFLSPTLTLAVTH